jgi:predicted phosphoribosyltransferase
MTVRRFADFADAGRQLAEELAGTYVGRDDVLVVGVEPYGLEVARATAEALGLPVVGVAPDGSAPEGVTGQVVLLVDDGVEGGGTASRLAALLRAAGPQRLVLAVPVCPREPYAALALVFDEVVALERPLMTRSLAWHYKAFPTAHAPQVP